MTRVILAALLCVVAPLSALAQSGTAASGTLKPTTTAPASGTTQSPVGRPKVVIPPAARSGESALRVGEGAMDAGPVEIRRNR